MSLMRTRVRAALLVAAALALQAAPACAQTARSLAPIPAVALDLMRAKDTNAAAPLVIRTFKKEAELEIWKLNSAGRYVYIKTFPICRWSGQLGPKLHSGDRQTPEGFYAIAQNQMNPNSHYYLSFDTGFPNAYDRAQGATGSAVMVHGTCSSMGCFAMTDRQAGEIYAIAREALKGGQKAFQMQAYPFHMTPENMALYRADPNIGFWNQLKEGSDRFESTGEILEPGVEGKRYVFAPSSDPTREQAAKAFHQAQLGEIARLVKEGSAEIRTTYSDGGQNAIFAAMMRKGVSLGTVSRPEALAYAGIDVTLMAARKHPHPARAVAALEPPVPLKASVLRAHAAPVPERIDPLILAQTPLQYSLFNPPAVPGLIAGAMPTRVADLAN
jgi:murein L,D-transpeptidase YafK